jgi:hypothetical protein
VVFTGPINFILNTLEGATEYYFEYTDTSPNTPTTQGSGWISATSYTVNMSPGIYTWRVKGRNASGESGWSETCLLTVVDPPALISPPNGAAFSAGPINFAWNAVLSNVVSGTTEYQFEYSDTPSFATSLGTSGWISVTNYSVNLNSGTYYWHVKARNGTGESGWSPVRTLTITNP